MSKRTTQLPPNFDDLPDDWDESEDFAADEMALDEQLAHSGYVAVIGKPNVGKSTLMNAILGEKVAIVSPKPQTTRLRQLGIYSTSEVQVIFVDTPGIHVPRHKLGEFMMTVAQEALRDADAILFVCDLTTPPEDDDQRVAEMVRQAGAVPVMLALNKLDAISADKVLPHTEAYRALLPNADWESISARRGAGVEALLKRLIEFLPTGPRFYPQDQLSDSATRDIVAEMVREKALHNLEQEVPHAIAVEVEEFTERSPRLTYIRVTIYVERDSQKAILIGKGGAMLKRIATEAREEIQDFLGTQVFLEPWVKVLKNWRKDEAILARLGYKLRR